MKASVAFVLLAFLSATTAKVHLQKRKTSEVIEDQDEANNFLKRQSGCPCRTCDSKETCCDPRSCLVTGPSAGKCSKHPAEISREITEQELREIKTLPTASKVLKNYFKGWR